MQEKFCLEMLGCKVNYITDLPLIDFIKEHARFTEFNECKILPYDNSCKYIVKYVNSREKKVASYFDKLKIAHPVEELDEECILYAGMTFFERQYAEKSMFTCHSACIEKDGKGILFLGDAGAGKTSLALRMCLDKNYSLLSNDQTVVGLKDQTLKAFKGTQFINFRKTSVENNLPEFLYLFNDPTINPWTQKINVHADDIGIKTSKEETELKKVYFVHCLNGQELNVKPATTFGNQFKLYQNLSMHIRGAAASLHDRKGFQIGYSRSLETKKTDNNRRKVINTMNNLQDFSLLTGSMNDIINYIEKEM